MKVDKKKLEVAMARKCISSEELGAITGISMFTINRLKAEQPGRTKTIGLIAKALEVDVTEIIIDEAAATAKENNQGSRDN